MARKCDNKLFSIKDTTTNADLTWLDTIPTEGE